MSNKKRIYYERKNLNKVRHGRDAFSIALVCTAILFVILSLFFRPFVAVALLLSLVALYRTLSCDEKRCDDELVAYMKYVGTPLREFIGRKKA